MRRLLVILIWGLLATAVAVVWAVFHPDSALVARAAEWPWVGPYAQGLRRRGPGPRPDAAGAAAGGRSGPGGGGTRGSAAAGVRSRSRFRPRGRRKSWRRSPSRSFAGP